MVVDETVHVVPAADAAGPEDARQMSAGADLIVTPNAFAETGLSVRAPADALDPCRAAGVMPPTCARCSLPLERLDAIPMDLSLGADEAPVMAWCRCRSGTDVAVAMASMIVPSPVLRELTVSDCPVRVPALNAIYPREPAAAYGINEIEIRFTGAAAADLRAFAVAARLTRVETVEVTETSATLMLLDHPSIMACVKPGVLEASAPAFPTHRQMRLRHRVSKSTADGPGGMRCSSATTEAKIPVLVRSPIPAVKMAASIEIPVVVENPAMPIVSSWSEDVFEMPSDGHLGPCLVRVRRYDSGVVGGEVELPMVSACGDVLDASPEAVDVALRRAFAALSKSCRIPRDLKSVIPDEIASSIRRVDHVVIDIVKPASERIRAVVKADGRKVFVVASDLVSFVCTADPRMTVRKASAVMRNVLAPATETVANVVVAELMEDGRLIFIDTL